jgi:hypothetical protein
MREKRIKSYVGPSALDRCPGAGVGSYHGEKGVKMIPLGTNL